MSNITFSIDDSVLRRIKVVAAQHGTSINAMVRDYFSSLLDSGLEEAGTLNGNQRMLFDYSVGRIGRSRVRKVLGVDDATLALMMRASGFPPPRASVEQENAMLDEIKDIHLAA